MDKSLNGKKIRKVFWPDSASQEGAYLSISENCDDLYMAVDINEEAWIVQIKDGIEVARHNPRYAETIIWAKVERNTQITSYLQTK